MWWEHYGREEAENKVVGRCRTLESGDMRRLEAEKRRVVEYIAEQTWCAHQERCNTRRTLVVPELGRAMGAAFSHLLICCRAAWGGICWWPLEVQALHETAPGMPKKQHVSPDPRDGA